jgi:phenylalanyl-tRNA synthetase beta chain
VHEVAAAEHLSQAEPLQLRRRRVTQVLGVEIADDMVEDILGRLGMSLQAGDDGWSVQPPSSRFDLVDEVDSGYTEVADDVVEKS